MMSFDAFLNRPHLCRECCGEIPADLADVDIDDEGQTVATCDECKAERDAAERVPTTDPTVRRARVNSMRWLRIYLASARGELPDNGEPAWLKWHLVWRAADRFLFWRDYR